MTSSLLADCVCRCLLVIIMEDKHDAVVNCIYMIKYDRETAFMSNEGRHDPLLLVCKGSFGSRYTC